MVPKPFAPRDPSREFLAPRPLQTRNRNHTKMLARFTRTSRVAALLRSTRALTITAIRRADPWPLPHTPQHIAATQTPKGEAPIPPIPRVNESEEKKRARLVYQSRKRGTLETDLLLSTFARDYLTTMSMPELEEYDQVRQSFC